MVYYAVPQPLVVQIGPPPSGYRYVRVVTDILLLAVGTGMVVDAIQDLGRTRALAHVDITTRYAAASSSRST